MAAYSLSIQLIQEDLPSLIHSALADIQALHSEVHRKRTMHRVREERDASLSLRPYSVVTTAFACAPASSLISFSKIQRICISALSNAIGTCFASGANLRLRA